MDKEDVMCVYTHTHTHMHTHTEKYYTAIKKDDTVPFVATWMDLEDITLNEISQMEKDKYHMILLICGI